MKYWVITTLYWSLFYLGMRVVLVKLPGIFFQTVFAYVCSFTLILFFAWSVHAKYDFRVDASVLVARPFYFDHTLYGCCLLLLMGFLLAFRKMEIGKTQSNQVFKAIGLIILPIHWLGVYLSFSRAVWISLILSLIFIFFWSGS